MSKNLQTETDFDFEPQRETNSTANSPHLSLIDIVRKLTRGVNNTNYYKKTKKNRSPSFYKVYKNNIWYDDKLALSVTIVNMTELARNLILQKQVLEKQSRVDSL